MTNWDLGKPAHDGRRRTQREENRCRAQVAGHVREKDDLVNRTVTGDEYRIAYNSSQAG